MTSPLSISLKFNNLFNKLFNLEVPVDPIEPL